MSPGPSYRVTASPETLPAKASDMEQRQAICTVPCPNPDPQNLLHNKIVDLCPNIHCSTVYNRQAWKKPKCPWTEEWVKRMCYIYTMEYYPAIKKNEIMPFAATLWT